MTEHPNAATLRRMGEAWNSGDLDVVRQGFADDAVFHFPGNNAMSGTYRGQEAVMDALGRALQSSGLHTEMETILASDDHILAFYRVTSARPGKTLDVVETVASKVNAQGQITEGWFLVNDQRSWDQFWS